MIDNPALRDAAGNTAVRNTSLTFRLLPRRRILMEEEVFTPPRGGRPSPEPQGVPREVRAVPKPFPDDFPEDSLRDGGQCQKNIGSPVDMLVNTVSRMQKDLAILREENQILRTPATSQVIQAPRRVALTMMKVPRFDGTTSWEQYYQVFEAIVRSNGWDNDTAELQLFSHLDGDALNVAHLVPLARRLSRSGLVDALTAHYDSPGRLADYRKQFERTTRSIGEDPAIFATALETLAVKAFGDMGHARPWDPGGGTVSTYPPRRTILMTFLWLLNNPGGLNCRQTEDMDCLPHAVCYDCVCLMPLIRITMPLFSDGDETANRTGYDRDYDGSPAGLLGCLPRRLYLLWVMDGMTQCQTKINGPYSDTLLYKTMNDGGRRDVRISITPTATHAGRGFSLTLIGHRASVGGSAGLADWPCMLSAVDSPPGGVWIDFIRRTVEDSQSIVAVPVTGSLVSLTLFSRRDAYCTYRSSILCDICTMGCVDQYRSSTGTVPLRNVLDVFGMSGRRDSTTESRILQGRDARSV